MNPDFVSVVVAAGEATRFGGPAPKQFEELAGRSVLARSVEAVTSAPEVLGAVVVLSPEQLHARGDALLRQPEVLRVVAGGDTRARSVRLGLEAVGGAEYALVHDAARPMASNRLVADVIRATREHGAAVPLLPVTDTVKRLDSDGRILETVDRSLLRQAQTPQGARTDWLVDALDRAEKEGLCMTDECQALELAGRPVAPVPGDPGNAKITSVDDLESMRRRLDPGIGGLRVGQGFDVHRVDPQRRLVLGGVLFDGEPGLAGHSDADVLLHAGMDALLGAAALGDIGCLFPPEEERWAGADSRGLAAEVAVRLSEEGYEILNLDLTLLAERPKIRPMLERMRESIARCFGTGPDRIGLKATTLERLGSLGRREGMAAQAVALLFRHGKARS